MNIVSSKVATEDAVAVEGTGLPLAAGDAVITPIASGEAGSVTPIASGEAGSVTPIAAGETGSVTTIASGEAGSVTTIAAGEAGSVTPMMKQYLEIKAANPDCLLFYRMGDFYELFFQDAEIAARALNIVLTRRGKHNGADIPMCGVPVVRSDEYLHKLIAAGFRVAVCEQTEDPAEAKKRGAKSVVQRGVTRLITAGTLTEDSLLDARRNNYLAAIVRAKAPRPMRRRSSRLPHSTSRPPNSA